MIRSELLQALSKDNPDLRAEEVELPRVGERGKRGAQSAYRRTGGSAGQTRALFQAGQGNARAAQFRLKRAARAAREARAGVAEW